MPYAFPILTSIPFHDHPMDFHLYHLQQQQQLLLLLLLLR